VAGGELHAAERGTGVEGGHDERRSEHVGVDAAEPGAAADRVDPTVGGAAVEALAVTASQDGPSWCSPMLRSMCRPFEVRAGSSRACCPCR
jgi:hypothetical protein